MKNNCSYLLVSLLLLGAKTTLAMSESEDLGVRVVTKRALDRADKELRKCMERTKLSYESYDTTAEDFYRCHALHESDIFKAVVAGDLLPHRRVTDPSSLTAKSSLSDVDFCKLQRHDQMLHGLDRQKYRSRLPGFLGEWRREHKWTIALEKCVRKQRDIAIKVEIALPILHSYTRCVSTEHYSPTDCQKRLIDDLRRYDKGGLAALTADQR